MSFRLFNLKDLRDLTIDKIIPLYIYNGQRYIKHYFERTELDYIFDRTTKTPHPIHVLHNGQWFHIDDASHLKLKDSDPVGYGVLLFVKQ